MAVTWDSHTVSVGGKVYMRRWDKSTFVLHFQIIKDIQFGYTPTHSRDTDIHSRQSL